MKTSSFQILIFFTALFPNSIYSQNCCISNIKDLGILNCDEQNGKFNQEIEITFTNAPATGLLILNGRDYAFCASPQKISINQDLIGSNIDVTAYFEEAVTELDNFDSSIENWGYGDESMQIPSLISGGINGNNDNYLQVTSTGTNGANGRAVVRNTEQWSSLTYGSHVSFDAINCGSSTLNIRISFDGPGGKFSSWKSYELNTSSVWTHCVFELIPANFYAIDGATDFQASLNNVSELRILSDQFPSWTGALYAACIGLDNIVTGGCVLSAEDLFQAPTECPLPYPSCAISNIQNLGILNCDELNGSFNQEIEITYSDAPPTGTLNLNGRKYDITSSPQIVSINQDLIGSNIDVTAYFEEAVTELDNFDSSIENWGYGDESMQIPSLISGGINGNNDYYLQVTSTGTNGANSRAVVRNTDQWSSLTYGSHVSFDAKNCGSTTLYLRISFDGPGGKFTSLKSYELSTSSVWTHCVFELIPSDFQAIDEATDFQASLNNISELRILSAQFPSWTGDTQSACIGLDNIVTGGCVLSAEDLFQAPTECPLPYPSCAISNIQNLGILNCDELNGSFNQEIEITYSDAPPTGTLNLNGRKYDITSSPQIVSINKDLIGSNIDVTAYFEEAVTELDNFDSSIENWGYGDQSMQIPSLISDGINGNNDNYLQVTSTGTAGANGRAVVRNTEQWSSLTYGSHVSFDAKNCGSTTLYIRISFDGPGGKFTSWKSYELNTSSVWTHCVFELISANFYAIDGATDFQASLNNVSELRILSAEFPSWTGDQLFACIGLDNIVTGGCVLSAEDLFQAPTECPLPSPVKADIQSEDGDIFLENSNRGVILKSPDGNCWRTIVLNGGRLKTTSVPCP